MFEKIINRTGNKFYSVNSNTVEEAQETLGIILPKELKAFYRQVGYGFLYSKEYKFNRIMSPQSLCEFRFRKGMYSNDTDLDVYEDYERDKIIFFEISEGNYLSIGFSKGNNGEIFYGKRKIANSLSEFLIKYQEDENYLNYV